MKISFKKCIGLTIVEVVVVLAALAIVIFLVISKARVSNSASRITCVNNLKQVGLVFRLYAGDNNDRYPMNISTNDKPLVNEATPVYQYLQLLQNELGTPKVLICPSDNKRKGATDFTNFSNTNVSYFIGLDSDDSLTNAMVAGDRNISNGFPPKDGILRLTAKQKVGFTKEMHIEQGNIALGDGSVQQVSSARLRSDIIKHSPFATNRIKLP